MTEVEKKLSEVTWDKYQDLKELFHFEDEFWTRQQAGADRMMNWIRKHIGGINV